MRIETLIDSVDNTWIKGHTIRYVGEEGHEQIDAITPWVRIANEAHKRSFWMLRPPHELFADYGMSVSDENAAYLAKIFEETWIDGVYFFFACTDGIREIANEVAKIIINEISATANEIANMNVMNLYHPSDIRDVCKLIFIDKKIDKKQFKEVIERISFDGDTIEAIASDPRYAKIDSSFLDAIIEKVVAENAAKNDGSEKIVNWFIGQVMKEAKGKANASEVREKLKARL
jgi:Asp-tRNA(Asn)/Glu-tRNA(Gln) amidotransferase B subunit